MPRNLRALVIVIAAVLALAASAPAASSAPATTQNGAASFMYATGDVQGPGIYDPQSGGMRKYPGPNHTPAGTVAAGSWVAVVPSGSRFTIHVDDYALPDGQVVYLMVGRAFVGCVPVRSEQTITGLQPGERAEVSVGMPDGQVFCGGLPVTAGVVTLRGAVVATSP